jgi:4-hydroxy-3-methylbut-2-en-1-yl diphosphate reductase
LYEVCKQNNPNTFFISGLAELNIEMFEPDDKVGICGATSTPMWLMEQVKSRLLSY